MGWLTCSQCKEPFMLHPETEATLRRSSQWFHCPWGHRQYFPQGQSETDKLRQERDRLKQNQAYLEDRIRAETERRELIQRQARAFKGQVTKLKNRAANGVCPCCNRTFANLQRHMATKHAGFVAEEVTLDGATIQ